MVMSDPPLTENRLRLAELLASLSLAIDLGMGEPMEWVLKACLLGVRLSETLGLSQSECREVYFVTLLRHIGCTSTAEVVANLLGDELAVGKAIPLRDEANMGVALRYLFENLGPVGRVRNQDLDFGVVVDQEHLSTIIRRDVEVPVFLVRNEAQPSHKFASDRRQHVQNDATRLHHRLVHSDESLPHSLLAQQRARKAGQRVSLG